MGNDNKSVSRRSFMVRSAAGAAGVVAASATAKLHADDFAVDQPDRALGGGNRALNAFRVRVEAAKTQVYKTFALDDQLDNNDESRYRNDRFYASFSKTLPHNQYGEVSANAFKRLRRAMRTGRQQDFDRIPSAVNASRKLANPQGAFRFALTGLDSHATRMPPAPRFKSAITAAEMGELYWQANTRDVAFIDYASDSSIQAAVDDLNAFSKTVGPKVAGQVTAQTLFRGETPGDLIGPYISQFLYQPVPYGPSTIEQRYQTPVAGLEFMLDNQNWLGIQRGEAPAENSIFDPLNRYIYNNRALGEYVHRDVLFQAYFNAALIMLGYGAAALDEKNPYVGNSANEAGFTTFGGPFIIDLLTQAANLSLSGAWFQKWRVHRRLRPEAFGGRIHHKLVSGRNYEIHGDILNSQALAYSQSLHGSSFLPMAYIEGSPTHPAYPAGHATVAGACCTVLKACFKEGFILPDTVQANSDGTALLPFNDTALSLGNEINKLAANVSLGRDAAGVHYRTDGIDGLSTGEQQAIALLQDYSLTTNEDFDGFSLIKFDGTPITIVNGEII